MKAERSECDECKRFWQINTKKRPEPSAINMEMQTALTVCRKCGRLWEESQRLAKLISEDEARFYFPRYFKSNR